MILTANEIIKQSSFGNITISPFDCNCLKNNSYIYHLSNNLLVIDNVGDIKKPEQSHSLVIPKDGFVLEPHKLYLGTTGETIGSDHFVTSLIGFEDTAKLGIYTQITADLGQIGTAHQWTLEIEVVQNVKVYPWMEFGQVSFWVPYGNFNPRVEYYATQSKPHISKLFEELQ